MKYSLFPLLPIILLPLLTYVATANDNLESVVDNSSLKQAASDESQSLPGLEKDYKKRVDEAITRLAIAKRRIRKSEFDAALANLLWILDGGVKSSEKAWQNAVPELAQLARMYSPAAKSYDSLRDKSRFAWEANQDSDSLRALFEFNHFARYENENLALFDSLPVDSPDKKIFGKRLFRVFWENARYEDFLKWLDHEERFNSQLQGFERINLLGGSPEMRQHAEGMLKQSVFEVSARSLEALLRTNRINDAASFARKVLDFEDSLASRTYLKEAAARAGHSGFLSKL